MHLPIKHTRDAQVFPITTINLNFPSPLPFIALPPALPPTLPPPPGPPVASPADPTSSCWPPATSSSSPKSPSSSISVLLFHPQLWLKLNRSGADSYTDNILPPLDG